MFIISGIVSAAVVFSLRNQWGGVCDRRLIRELRHSAPSPRGRIVGMRVAGLKHTLRGIICFLTAFFSASLTCGSQTAAVKSNLLYDFTTTFNAGAEFRLAPKWTLDISGNLNPWTFSGNARVKHWLVQPEARYWFCDAWAGSFLAMHLVGGQFNAGGIDTSLKLPGTDFSSLRDRRYQGWLVGLGAGYGHAFVLDEHWNLELEGGIGWVYAGYDTFRCAGCGKKIEENRGHHYFGPTKFAVSLVYLF
mgnify:CR=1 FL=1